MKFWTNGFFVSLLALTPFLASQGGLSRNQSKADASQQTRRDVQRNGRFAVQGEGNISSREEGGLWIAGNQTIEVAIDKSEGTVKRLLDKASMEDYCNQIVRGAVPARDFVVGERIAGISVYDELKNVEFSDLTQKPVVSDLKSVSTADGAVLSFRKKFPGSEFDVYETFRLTADHLRWDVTIKKTAGADRTLRVVQFAPLPLGDYEGWAAISDAPFEVKPYFPFSVQYGQSVSGSVGEIRWRTLIPSMVFYSEQKNRAISFTHPFEVPAVRIRFMNNTSSSADFHWNSQTYPPRQRPYFQVVNEYLGLRDKKNVETSVLIASHAADWRPALGWIYEKYREYFDPDPNFDQWDGVYETGYDLMKDSYTEADLREILDGRRERGARWEELHGHFPWYGLMIPEPAVKSWICESHPMRGHTDSREKIAEHARLDRQFGIGTFIYYNTTEAEYWYAEKEFPESIAKDEEGRSIGAFRAADYPSKRACWLMNSDPSSKFGKHMMEQARAMVEAYPAIAGFFWDVYGRSYMFDFAHDDGITMVNNKPAYYPEFMFERTMKDYVGPLLRSKGMCITANKPTTIVSCKGIDGVMARESTPDTEEPPWIAAQSYTGLNRHVMILDGLSGTRAELLLLDCLRYGMFYSDLGTVGEKHQPLPPEQIEANARLAKTYLPFIQRFRGKKWIFCPRALELPKHTDGNIFRLKDGSVMITMVSYWRAYRKAGGFQENVNVTCRLPDAENLKNAYVTSLDLQKTWKVEPARNGSALTITVPRHGSGTTVVLSSEPEADLEAKLN